MAASLIAMMADDAWASQLTLLEPLLTAHGMKASLYVPATVVGRSGKLTVANLTALQTLGWNVCSHGFSSGPMTRFTIPELQVELAAARAWHIAHGFAVGGVHLGPPSDQWSPTLTPYAVAAGFTTVRCNEGKGTLLPSPWKIELRGVGQWKEWSTITGYVDAAVATPNTLLCLVCHRVVPDACDAIRLDTKVSRMLDVIHYVLASGLATTTISAVP